MKKTLENIKRVYSYGKDYKMALFWEILGSVIDIIVGIVLPIIIAKQIVYLTNNTWKQLILTSLGIMLLNLLLELHRVLIRKNTQKFTEGQHLIYKKHLQEKY